jgi:hypothetical protein
MRSDQVGLLGCEDTNEQTNISSILYFEVDFAVQLGAKSASCPLKLFNVCPYVARRTVWRDKSQYFDFGVFNLYAESALL